MANDKAVALVEFLVKCGKLSDERVAKNDCYKVIAKALSEKEGVERKVRTIASDGRKYRNTIGFITVALRNLPDIEPVTNSTIEDEIRGEVEDLRDHAELMKELHDYNPDTGAKEYNLWTPPNHPRLFKRPSILECAPYQGKEELYASNTYIEVHRKALESKTSMHQICRDLGLEYGFLIM